MASTSISRNATKLLTRRKPNLNPAETFNNVRQISVWTPDLVVRSPFKDVEIPNVGVSEHIWQNLERWADKTAVVRNDSLF